MRLPSFRLRGWWSYLDSFSSGVVKARAAHMLGADI
jgi:hypothetical protein